MTQQDIEQYKNLTEMLKNEKHRFRALNNIKYLIENKSASEAAPIIKNIGISKILQCLNVPNKEQVDLTCDVLKLCFDKFEIGDFVKTYTGHVMYLLRHENDCVRSLVMEEVYKAVTTDAALLPDTQYIDMFVAIGQMVSDKDEVTAYQAVDITSHRTAAVYPKILEEMKIALEGNSTSKCNAFEVVISVSLQSQDLFEICVQQEYFDVMVTELDTMDILYQLNILELLSDLAIKPYSINFLVRQGILQKMIRLIEGLETNPFGSLLIPGYLKFFGCLAHYYPKEIFQKYPPLLDLLYKGLDSDDLAVLPVALDTLGFIGATSEGKLCLLALGSKFTQNVEKLGVIIKNSPTEMKICALHCMASLISVHNDPVDQRVTLMTREWLRSMSKGSDPMTMVFEICRNPFPDISLAGMSLLDAVCQHKWGEEMVARVAGFMEYLLDRSVDSSKELKEAKYNIIKRLSQSTAFDDNIIMRMQTYVEKGPFYSETTLQVAMEEE